jgi:hypothetical protein
VRKKGQLAAMQRRIAPALLRTCRLGDTLRLPGHGPHDADLSALLAGRRAQRVLGPGWGPARAGGRVDDGQTLQVTGRTVGARRVDLHPPGSGCSGGRALKLPSEQTWRARPAGGWAGSERPVARRKLPR